jgi:hypothetical protein
MVVCGKAGFCEIGLLNSYGAPDADKHEVRCCVDTKPAGQNGWKKTVRCDVWSGSDEGFTCQHALSFNDAAMFFRSHGARLCTQLELEHGCGADTGCGHNYDHMWSSTALPSTYGFNRNRGRSSTPQPRNADEGEEEIAGREFFTIALVLSFVLINNRENREVH